MSASFERRIARIGSALSALRDRLEPLGYVFADAGAVLPGPSRAVEQVLAAIERRVGPVPLAYSTFQRRVGAVNFLGRPPWTGGGDPDPVMVYPIEEALRELEEFEQDRQGYSAAFGGFRIPISPDAIGKEGASGGMWYGIAVPSPGDDPPLLEEPHQTSFLSYLELAIEWGGFPGLESAEGWHDWPIDTLIRDLHPPESE